MVPGSDDDLIEGRNGIKEMKNMSGKFWIGVLVMISLIGLDPIWR
jgi:hypothetical protein